MSGFTQNYLNANTEQTKRISLVVNIDGIGPISNNDIFAVVKYGDPTIFYGEPGLVYGGLKRLDPSQGGPRSYLSLDSSSLIISQRIEPEQGRGSVTTLSLAFIDKNGYMTQVISPGVFVPEILGRKVTIQMGYQDVSYPTDYFVIFRGYVTQVNSVAGLVTIQISDANFRRRQNIFFCATTTLASAIDNVTTTIPVAGTGSFFQQIKGPNGSFDPAIHTYVKIDNEFIEYPASGVTSNSFINTTRGSRTTAAASHSIGTSVAAFIQVQDHAIDMALKLMLSGWNGPWISGVPVLALARTLDATLGDIPNAITFPNGVDVVRDYGLSVGDYVSISGSAVSGNNLTSPITNIISINSAQPNQVIEIASNLTAEYPTVATVSFRSQFDTYPVECGAQLTTNDVDVAGHLQLKADFLADASNSYRFLIAGPEAAKQFIETELYLPVAAYAVTRQGRLSVKMTVPPISAMDLQILGFHNILNPDKIQLMRATNNRAFFNDITFSYDLADDLSTYQSQFEAFDSDSLTLIGIASTLPITSRGSRSDLSGTSVFQKRAQMFLSRYKRGATQINLDVNWQVGNLIEAGDVVGLDGDGLFLSNFNDGSRNFGTQLFEVVNRSMDIRQGFVSLQLISGIGATLTDRFGTVSPSSFLTSGSTQSSLHIKDSFSALHPVFPGQEWQKWQPYVGLPIMIHSEDYSFVQTTTLVDVNSVNPYFLDISPPLTVPPPSGYVIDIVDYPSGTQAFVDSLYKNVHFFMSPRVDIVSGLSPSSFTVSPSDIGKFFDGCIVRVHNASFTDDSGELSVGAVSGNTVVTVGSMGFTPTAVSGVSGDFVELIGFADHGGSYRVI